MVLKSLLIIRLFLNIPVEEIQAPGTVVHIALDGSYAGCIVISDEVKDDSKEAIKALRGIGTRKLVMLTGDSRTVAEKVGNDLGLDEVFWELLPDQKVEKLETLDKEKPPKGKLIFVGDGINDAPVLARADVGVAMGGVGSDVAIEAADVVLMTDEPARLVAAIKIAKRTRGIVWQNIIFAMAVKGIVRGICRRRCSRTRGIKCDAGHESRSFGFVNLFETIHLIVGLF